MYIKDEFIKKVYVYEIDVVTWKITTPFVHFPKYFLYGHCFFVCVSTHPFPVALMYGGRSISRGQRLTVRQDDLLTVDIWR